MTSCSFTECDRPAKVRGYCSTCYYRLRRRGEFADLPPVREKKCAADDCTKSANPSGGRYCKMHANRLARWGSLDGKAPATPEHYAVLARIAKSEACWEWTGTRNEQGYGLFHSGTTNRLAHRIVFGYYFGEVAPTVQIDHMCGNPACVNPDHLRSVTPKQNTEHFVKELRSTNTSGFRGVSYNKRRNRWRARVESAGQVRASYHLTREAAAEAARKMRLEMHTHNDRDRGV